MSDEIATGLSNVAEGTYNAVNNVLMNPSIILILVGVVFLYVVFFVFLGEGTNSSINMDSMNMNSMNMNNMNVPNVSNSSSNIIYMIVIVILLILIIVNGLKYFFGIDILAKLSDILTGITNPDITSDDTSRAEAAKSPVPAILLKPQVFNISENQFSYPDAKAVCSAYGARLATYTELEEAYGHGADWCNYGWSDGQMALFPTQQKTFDQLQKIEGHENDCGRPGINGEYMKNPALRFGVNCYGYKPRMTNEEEERMANDPIYPKTKKDIAMENRVQYWKDQLASILVNPFNYKNWSAI